MFSQPCTFHPRASCLSVLWNLLTMNVDLPPMNLCKHFYSIGTYNIINLYQLRATSSIRLFFTVKNSTLLISAPSLLFLPSFFSSIFFFLGRMLMYCSKGTFPVSSTSPFRKGVCVQSVPFVIMNFGHILA